MTTFPTTTPGYKNKHGQIVIARTGFPSESFPGQTIYHLRCSHCHQEGAKGELLRAAPANLFSSEGV